MASPIHDGNTAKWATPDDHACAFKEKIPVQYPSSSFLPLGVATGIGSLPYMDTQTALALIAEHLPEIPHWPQLPQRGRCEHFIHQFLQPMVDCGLLQMVNDRWIVDRSRQTLPRRLTRFYERYLPESMDDSRWLSCCMPPRDAAIGFHASWKVFFPAI